MTVEGMGVGLLREWVGSVTVEGMGWECDC